TRPAPRASRQDCAYRVQEARTERTSEMNRPVEIYHVATVRADVQRTVTFPADTHVGLFGAGHNRAEVARASGLWRLAGHVHVPSYVRRLMPQGDEATQAGGGDTT